MTKPTTKRFGQMLIEVGDGGSPEVFGAPCGLTSKDFNLQANTADTNTPDCDDPDAPSWLERDIVSLSRDINGSGVLAYEFLPTWDDWGTSGEARNCRVTIGAYVWTGAYRLTAFNIGASKGEKIQLKSVVLTSDGQITRA